ncbi:MAG TPA: PSD1 and planctomycete cytochrome C domain-containing protein [Gemmataceae bacterium]|nr:PSD1 and planctomycete cytochrome C domain-containing protein [Gemmataceae bacterium]
MLKRFPLVLGVLALAAGALLAVDKTPDPGKLPPAAARPVDFERDIKPIFTRACISCHGPEKQRAGLRLDDGTQALKGGDSGPVIKPGDAKGSRLLHAVAGIDPDLKMPPAPRTPLTTEEVSLLRAWIEQGAKWPKDNGTTVARSARSNHWSFQPIKRPAVPPVQNTAWVRNPIDHFILARLEKEGIAPSPEADRATLIRRLSLDLLGLPPTPEEVDAFLADTRPDAYERLVDRLLDSPHYGERWGRHWLDVARYADSDGYEKDTGRPYAYRWRDWVINAFNRDLPFDQFTIEQLAGDLLPGATLEQKIATGFHRNTLTNREGGVDQEQFRVEAVVDRVNTTAKVWLGVTLGCAQCHDHKYDPFSQREYYQFFAFFNSDVETDLPAPTPEEEADYRQKKAAFDKKKAQLQKALDDYKAKEQPANQEKWEKELTPEERRKLPADIAAILDIEPAKRDAKQQKQLTAYYSKIDPKLGELQKALNAHQRTAPREPIAPTLALGPERKTHVLIRGDFLRPGIEVQPGTPAVLHPLTPTPLPRPSGERGRGEGAEGKPTRLDLARWLVDPANPLTARVIVNWMWYHYFGRGIVPTLEDFGTQGEKPSHPELLDWLASEFIAPSPQPSPPVGGEGKTSFSSPPVGGKGETSFSSPPAGGEGRVRGWSMKAMHRLIVTSMTYRQSSKVRPELLSRDPLNVLLARQSRLRLEAEVIRDNALAASGLLVRKIGGPSVRPPQPAGISELTYANSARWVESTGPDRYRRGLYTWFQRTSPYPMLMTFDAPDGNVACVRRERSNTPLQALTLLNDTVFVECAQALGRRMVEERMGPSERIRHGFRLCLAREPSADELELLGKLYDDLLTACKADPEAAAKLLGKEKPAGADPAEAAAGVALARTIMNLDEFVTRE